MKRAGISTGFARATSGPTGRSPPRAEPLRTGNLKAMGNDAITYCVHAVSVRECALLTTMIDRVSRRIGRPIRYAPAAVAQIVFFEGRRPAGSRGTVFVQLTRDSGREPGPGTLPMPPHMTHMLELFAGAARDRGIALGCGPATDTVRAVCDLFQKAGPPHALVNETDDGLLLFPGARQFARFGRNADETAAQFFQSEPLQDLRLKRMDDAALALAGDRQSAEPALWYMGMAHARCGLFPWVSIDSLLRMRAWPYLAAGSPALEKIAALLRVRPHSASALVSEAGMAADDVIAFVNAALSCGFITLADPAYDAGADSPPYAPRPAKGSHGALPVMLNAIRKALGIPFHDRA